MSAKFWAKQNLSVKPPESGRRVELAEVQSTFLPPPTGKHVPVPHGQLIEAVIDAIYDRNFAIAETVHMLSHGGLRYYGLLDVKSRNYSADHSWIMCIQNSNDRIASTSIVAGARVHPSNAMGFSGEVNVTRKHTAELMTDLPRLADATVEELWGKWSVLDQRLEGYKKCALVNEKAYHLIVHALEKRIIRLNYIPKILNLWNRPRLDVFKSRTAWTLYSGFLLGAKDLRLPELIKNSITITKLFDEACDISLVESRWVQPELV